MQSAENAPGGAALEEGIRILSEKEARRLFDELAREEMGMSGAEFLRRWNAGEFAGQDEPGVIGMMMLLPLVERDGAAHAGTGG